MRDFESSGDFVARTMENVRSYEMARIKETEKANRMLVSKPALYALSAGGAVLGMWNLVRTVWTLIAPAACL